MKQKKTRKDHSVGRDLASLTPDEEYLLTELQTHLDHLDPKKLGERITSPQLARGLLVRLPMDHPKAVDFILALDALFQDKETRKEIKKARFKLKQKGIVLSFPEKEVEPVFKLKAEKAVESEAYVGSVDPFGNRAVFMSLGQADRGVDVGIGTINDEEGLSDFLFGRYSKKKAMEIKAILFSKFQQMVPTSMAHLATLLEKAYQRNAGGLNEAVRGYLQLRPWILAHVKLLEQPIIYERMAPDQVKAVPLTEALLEKLFGHPLMATWLLDPDQLKPLIEELIKAQESPILLSEPQLEIRIQDLKERTLVELFPESRKVLFKNRLEEMAYIFSKRKEEDFTQMALAVAVSLSEKESLASKNAFLRKLLERSLVLLLPDQGAAKGTQKEKPSLIIKP